jgi:hypothetical protein
MPNERQATILAESRATAAKIDELISDLNLIRARFNALGGTPGFQGTGLLFAADGTGQAVPYNDFLALFNALGTLEGTSGTPAAAWSAFLAACERLRG